jgi:manganese oxidase
MPCRDQPANTRRSWQAVYCALASLAIYCIRLHLSLRRQVCAGSDPRQAVRRLSCYPLKRAPESVGQCECVTRCPFLTHRFVRKAKWSVASCLGGLIQALNGPTKMTWIMMTGERTVFIPYQLFAVIIILVTSARALPHRSPLDRAEANDNRRAAGTLRDGVLTVALEAREAMWYPDGDQLPGTSAEAFGEAGRNPNVPGPLVRVPAGTEIRGSLRNSLPRDTITFYVPAKLSREAPADQLDSLVVPPGQVRPLRIRSVQPGTYLYRAVSGRRGTGRPVLRIDGLLAGAFVVDSAGVTAAPRDRVMVMQGLSDPRETGLPSVMAINGRSWPHTERLLAAVGDTLRWRVINASPEIHPMHLHGFYYRVDAFDLEERNTEESRAATGRMVVTHRMPPASTMSLTWVAEREGNWLFHCHFQRHIIPHQPLTELTTQAPAAAGDHVVDHALSSMSGLVMGVLVADKTAHRPRSPAMPAAERRHLRLVAIRDANFPDSLPSMRFTLEELGGARPLEAGAGFSPVIVLFRAEPVSIMVVNHLTEPTAVHWHGIELESYFDGVAGFSGAGARLAPIVAPGDSFEVLMTPPRSGTFIYHSHVDEPRQHRAGLVGPLIVRDRTDRNTTDDLVFFIKSARAGALANPEFEINGKSNPDTLVLKVGGQYRLRFIGLQVSNPNAEVTLTARADSVVGNPRDTLLVQWRPLAKDAIELPEGERTPRPARQVVTMGETYDFVFVPIEPGHLRMEVRVSVPRQRLMVRVPIRVE